MTKHGAYALLGIDANADERAIKRAYARLLKTTRPDEDPAGFQRLNEAYQHCLALLPPTAGGGLPVDDPAPPQPALADQVVQTPETPPQKPPQLDVQAFLDALGDRLVADPEGVLAWLTACEPLYSLKLKQAVAIDVLHMMDRMQPPPSPPALAAVLPFFGLDTLRLVAGIGPMIAALEQRSETNQRVLERRNEAARRFLLHTEQAMRSPHTAWTDRLLLRELMTPASGPALLRRAFLLFWPGLDSRMQALMLRLQTIDRHLFDTRLDPGSVGFWHSDNAAGRNLRTRILRAFIGVIMGVLGTSTVLAWLVTSAVDAAPPYGLTWWRTAALLSAGWATWMGLRWLWRRIHRWNRARLQLDQRWLSVVLMGAVALLTSPLWPAVSGGVMLLLTLYWLSPRSTGRPALFGVFAVLATALSTLVLMAFAGVLEAWELKLAFVCVPSSCLAMLLMHDWTYARRHRISVDHAARGTGWLGYVALTQAVALLACAWAWG